MLVTNYLLPGMILQVGSMGRTVHVPIDPMKINHVLDLLGHDAWKRSKTYYPKWWFLMVIYHGRK